MTLGHVKVTVKENQGSGTGDNFFIRTRNEDELEKWMTLALGAGLWLCLPSGAMGTSLMASHLSVHYGEMQRKKMKQKRNGGVSEEGITFNAARIFNLEDWVSFSSITHVFHMFILLLYVHVIILNLLYLSYHKFFTCEAQAQVLSQKSNSEV